MTDYSLPYSKRKQLQERTGKPTIFRYDSFPQEFRIQVHYEIFAAIGTYAAGMFGVPSMSPSTQAWDAIEAKLKREHALLDLSPGDHIASHKWRTHLLTLEDPDKVIDAIEIPLQIAIRIASQLGSKTDIERNRAHVIGRINEVNRRFREHDLGYEFVVAGDWGYVIRVDSQFVFSEVVEPVIASLYASGLNGPLEEFARAHQEYRNGHNKDAATEAAKAFESTMKAICDARGWTYKSGPNASDLVRELIKNGLVPQSLESYLMALPTLRNKLSAHGQGGAVVTMHDHEAAFALHLSASTIVFLMAAHQSLPMHSKAKQGAS